MRHTLLNEHDDLLAHLLDEAQRQQVYVIARLQRVAGRSVTAVNGRVEGVTATLTEGLGMHVFDREGHTAFAATDRLTPTDTEEALRAAIAGLRAAAAAGLERNPAIFEVEPLHAEVVPPGVEPIDALSLEQVQGLVEALNHETRRLGHALSVRTLFHIDRETWRIVRSDGTDVRYLLPHGYCVNSITARQHGATHTVNASLARTGYSVLREERTRLMARTVTAAETAQRLIGAPRYPAGAYPIVMDYAMAKGLAHEAFGHAAETDGLRSSILGRDGVFRRGERLAAPGVTIIDEPLVGDHAYQPFSPNGLPRTSTTIMRDGVLEEALADLFSAQRAGTRVIDAARAQHYGAVPVPRMTNIRIELPQAYELSGDFEEQTPERVRAALINAGLLRAGQPVIYLAGYKGGQVSTARGDFVFNCAALWELSVEDVRLFQPAIFSGQTEAALQAIRAGFGPLQLDAMGFCGKAGQSVPSSGGSHYFLYLEPHPAVRVGGR
ncbi:TldD/PmbA family protein [Kallotenue papyrolyticum]|uniref:TldD/PmbA family protein n=1 Tax=Kallotenue papyrolyticum TaxID=1325125 RepID=UPI0004714A3A|nr:TldD/PmbA family protein [Kallotenue papyrolyticum]